MKIKEVQSAITKKNNSTYIEYTVDFIKENNKKIRYFIELEVYQFNLNSRSLKMF